MKNKTNDSSKHSNLNNKNINIYKITLSILFGLLGFVLNFHTINFSFPPYTATVLIGLLFPMLITLTWGWRYGLLSALTGGCQSMWWLWGLSNGYAIFFVVPPFTLWIVWHGYFATLRRKRKNYKWWLNIYVIEIPFRILSTINLYTFARWVITLNPPSWNWASNSINVISIHFSDFVVIKQAIVGYIILLLANVLLNFEIIRRFFRLKEKNNQKYTGYVISASLLFGILFWIIDSLLGCLIFYTDYSFRDLLALNIPPYAHYIRSAFILACLVGGLVVSNLLRKQNKSEDVLREREKKLRENELKFRTLVEQLPTVTYTAALNKSSTTLYISPQIEKILGISPEDYKANPDLWLQLLHNEDRERVLKEVKHAHKTGQPLISEYRMVSPNGKIVYIRDEATIIKDEKDKPLYLQGIMHDITERKKVEETLRNTRDYLENLFNNANAPIIVWDPQFKISRFNYAFECLIQKSADEVLGKPINILFPTDRCEEAMYHIHNTKSGEKWKTVEIPILRADGVVRTVLWNSATLYTADGKTVIATIAQGQDITERKKAEEELRNTRDYLENLFNNANAPIIVWDPQFKISRFNYAFECLIQKSADEVLGKPINILFPTDRCEEAMYHIHNTKSGEKWKTVEIPILRADGVVRTVLWNSATLYTADGKTIIATIAQGQDITERKQAEEKIRKLNEELEQRVIKRTTQLKVINKELEAFAYSVSHDLRAPLRAINGFSQALLEDYNNKLDADGQDYLRRVCLATKRMGKLIDDLLNLSRVTRCSLHKKTFNISILVKKITSELQKREPERQMQFIIKPNLFVNGDVHLIRLALENLLDNAWKFTNKHINTKIEFGILQFEGEEVYFIRDDGAGFDMQYIDKLFGTFQRLHKTSEFSGTGVGLATVQRIIHRHGGRIWAESSIEEGATFYFIL